MCLYQACEANEEIQGTVAAGESGTDQASLLLEVQKENRDLRVQLARQKQKVITLEAQSLASNFSPTPSSTASAMKTPPSTAQPNEKRRLLRRSAFLGRTCFTPGSRNDLQGRSNELERAVKALEAEIERMKRDHAVQLKMKDELIRELSLNNNNNNNDNNISNNKRIVTRSSLRPKEPSSGELKSPSHRFRSPVAKKRSIWDITTANSPSIATLNGRKTKSHIVVSEQPGPAPSMLLQVQTLSYNLIKIFFY